MARSRRGKCNGSELCGAAKGEGGTAEVVESGAADEGGGAAIGVVDAECSLTKGSATVLGTQRASKFSTKRTQVIAT